jgi:predicted ATPase
MVRAWCDVAEGQVDSGRAALRQAFHEYGASGQRYGTTFFSLILARAHLAAGDAGAADEVLDAALTFAAETAERIYEPELHRLKGEAALLRGDPHQAAAHYQQALTLATERNALLFALRAAIALHRIAPRTAGEKLAALVARFSADDDCADLSTVQSRLARRSAGARPTPR